MDVLVKSRGGDSNSVNKEMENKMERLSCCRKEKGSKNGSLDLTEQWVPCPGLERLASLWGWFGVFLHLPWVFFLWSRSLLTVLRNMLHMEFIFFLLIAQLLSCPTPTLGLPVLLGRVGAVLSWLNRVLSVCVISRAMGAVCPVHWAPAGRHKDSEPWKSGTLSQGAGAVLLTQGWTCTALPGQVQWMSRLSFSWSLQVKIRLPISIAV